MPPIILVLGPSGVGKSHLSEKIRDDFNFWYERIDTDDKGKRTFEAKGFPKEWDKDPNRIDFALFAKIVFSHLSDGDAGAVVSLPTLYVLSAQQLVESSQLGVTPAILWGKQEDCIRAAKERINIKNKKYKKNITFCWSRYERNNNETFEAYKKPEYDNFREEVFREVGNHRSDEELLARIMKRVISKGL